MDENSKSKWFWKAKGTGVKEKKTNSEQQFCAGAGQDYLHLRTLMMRGGGPILHVRKMSLKEVK